MKQLYQDLWQTRTEHTIPGSENAVSNAYLLTRDDGNILFYGTGREAIGSIDDTPDLGSIEQLGGVRHHLIGHWHEASDSVARVKMRFNAELTCHAREAPMIEKLTGVRPDRTFWERGTIADTIEAIPTPGHSAGSASYLYRSPHGETYLFTGDTIVPADNSWLAGAFEDDPHQSTLKQSLDTLGQLEPTVVLAAGGIDGTYRQVPPGEWAKIVQTVKDGLG